MNKPVFFGDAVVLDADALHRRLAAFNAKRFAPTLPSDGDWRDELFKNVSDSIIEGDYLQIERATISAQAA